MRDFPSKWAVFGVVEFILGAWLTISIHTRLQELTTNHSHFIGLTCNPNAGLTLSFFLHNIEFYSALLKFNSTLIKYRNQPKGQTAHQLFRTYNQPKNVHPQRKIFGSPQAYERYPFPGISCAIAKSPAKHRFPTSLAWVCNVAYPLFREHQG